MGHAYPLFFRLAAQYDAVRERMSTATAMLFNPHARALLLRDPRVITGLRATGLILGGAVLLSRRVRITLISYYLRAFYVVLRYLPAIASVYLLRRLRLTIEWLRGRLPPSTDSWRMRLLWIALDLWLASELAFAYYYDRRIEALQQPGKPPVFTDAQREYQLSRASDAIAPADRLEHLKFWFKTDDTSAIGRENVAEFHAFNWFSKPFSALTDDERVMCRRIADTFAGARDHNGVSLAPGKNPLLRPALLCFDEFRSHTQHHPLIYYTAIELGRRAFTAVLVARGFRRHAAPNHITYWCRPARRRTPPKPGSSVSATAAATPSSSGGATAPASLPTPLVLVHGVGAGCWPYLPLAETVLRGDTATAPDGSTYDRAVFFVELDFISLTLTEVVPSPAQIVTDMTHMLATHGYRAGTFVGHSYGTNVVGYMLKRAPQCVASCVLLDPVCYLLMRPDFIRAVYYRTPTRAMELILNYVVATDLFILHAARRNFWWWENVLWAEETPRHTTVVLSGGDEVVPSAAVRAYLEPRGVRTVWLEGCSHAGFLFGGEHTRTVVNTIRAAVRYPETNDTSTATPAQ